MALASLLPGLVPAELLRVLNSVDCTLLVTVVHGNEVRPIELFAAESKLDGDGEVIAANVLQPAKLHEFEVFRVEHVVERAAKQRMVGGKGGKESAPNPPIAQVRDPLEQMRRAAPRVAPAGLRLRCPAVF